MGTLVVEGSRIAQVGRAADVRVPPGAARVNLAGKTVMPDLIDTHTHLSSGREALTRDLTRRAYYGVSAAMSMGTDETTAELDMRGDTTPGMARVFTAWHGITRPEPGRGQAPFWINTEDEGRKAVQELAARKVDIVKIWIDDRDGKFQKLHARALRRADHRRGKAQGRAGASPRTSGRSRTQKGCCAPVSTRSPTAYATATSTTSS